MFKINKILKNVKNIEFFNHKLKNIMEDKEIKNILNEMKDSKIDPDKDTFEIINSKIKKESSCACKKESESHTKRHSKEVLREIFLKKIKNI